MSNWDRYAAAIESAGGKVVKISESFLARNWAKWMRFAGITAFGTVYIQDVLHGNDRGAKVLRHELVHVRDQKKWGILFYLSYLLVLPIGPSFRALWEWRAYKEDLKQVFEDAPKYSPGYAQYLFDFYKQSISENFYEAQYGWMWPFPRHVKKFVGEFASSLKR